MSPEFEGRAECLSLKDVGPALSTAASSLKDVQSGEVRRFGRRDAVAFNSYQQLATLKNAWTDQEREKAIALIERFIESPAERNTEATQLIELFNRLQIQALWSFERPEAPPTEGLRELCKMTP